MACSIKIKENLIANIEQRTNDVMNKDLFTANKRAQYINSLFGYKVVSFSQSEKDFINRSITVPEELVQKYYDNETLIEQEEARQIQSEDAIRAGEEYAEDEYMFQRSSNEINYALKAVDTLQSDKAKQVFDKGNKNNWSLDKILTELQIPKEQKQLILDLGISDREPIALELASNYSYSVKINTTKTREDIDDEYRYYEENSKYFRDSPYDGKKEVTKEEFERNAFKENKNSEYYSNLTVPGGTNYTEQEISTPLITPSIKGHAAFSTENGVGWFRTDDKQNYTEQDIDSLIDDMIKSGVLQKNCS